MKKLIYDCLTRVNKIRYFTKSQIQISRGFFFNNKISITTDSQLYSLGNLVDCRIRLAGSHNLFKNYAHISSTEVRVIGDNCTVTIEKECNIRQSVIIVQGGNCNITIGKGTTVGSMYMVCMGNANSITIGEGCMLADNVEIWATDSHAVLDLQGNLLNPSKPVKIGNHVWIGKQAAIMKGVSIGDNAIVGMRSLVTNNIASGTLNVGSPSRCIRENINWDRSFITKYEASDEYSY